MKTVVITGSTRGFGRELSRCFRKKNYNVVISGTNAERLEKALAELSCISSKGEIHACVCDVRKQNDVENLYLTSEKIFGKVDIWINNAGVNQRDVAIMDLESQEIDTLLDIDLKGTIYGSKVAFKHMHKQGSGQIYNVEGHGSNDAIIMGLSLYGTSKRAVTYFTEALSKEADLLNSKVCIGKISPGIMNTNFLTTANSESGAITLNEKTKKVYNTLGDYPQTVAEFMADKIDKNTKNNVKFNWLTGRKALTRFMSAGFRKREFFS